jgi:hypothetical protein
VLRQLNRLLVGLPRLARELFLARKTNGLASVLSAARIAVVEASERTIFELAFEDFATVGSTTDERGQQTSND